jgi:hypothetical protein
VKDTLPEGYQLIEGSTFASYSSVDPGTTVETQYIAIPSTGNARFPPSPAIVTYSSKGYSGPRTLVSTIPSAFVLSTRQNIEQYLVKVVRAALGR